MKKAILVLFVLVACTAFGQMIGSVSSQAYPYHAPEHPEHASTHALAVEQYVTGGTSYGSAHGEKPMWEFQQQGPQAPLGDIARTLKGEHSKLKKARIKYEN